MQFRSRPTHCISLRKSFPPFQVAIDIALKNKLIKIVGKNLEKFRAFLAIEIPEGIRGWINGEIILPLSKLPVKVKWVEPKNIHLTIRFLGDITAEQADKIKSLSRNLSGLGNISLKLSELGTFGGRYPRVVWIGLEGDTDKLSELRERVEGVCRVARIPRDDKRFSPHVTIGRVKSPANTAKLIAEMKRLKVKPLSFVASEMILFKSTLTPEGPIYEKVERFKF